MLLRQACETLKTASAGRIRETPDPACPARAEELAGWPGSGDVVVSQLRLTPHARATYVLAMDPKNFDSIENGINDPRATADIVVGFSSVKLLVIPEPWLFGTWTALGLLLVASARRIVAHKGRHLEPIAGRTEAGQRVEATRGSS